MAANYEVMPLDQQLAIMQQEVKNTNMLEAKSVMWRTAATEFARAGKEMGEQADTVEPKWKDAPGQGFVAHARNTKRIFDKWHHNITTEKPHELLEQLSDLIPQAYATVVEQQKAFRLWYDVNAMTLGNNGLTREEAELQPHNWRRPSGALMNQIADLYGRATKAVDAASSGGKYEGLTAQLDPPKTGGANPGGGGGPTGGGGTTTPAPNTNGTDTTKDQFALASYAVDPETGWLIDPKTGFPIDPKTGLAVDPRTGLSIDPRTGLPIDPRTNLPFDPKAQPLDPKTGLPLGTDTTRIPTQAANPQLTGGLGTTPVTTPTLPPPTAGISTIPPTGTGPGLTPILPPVGTNTIRPPGLGGLTAPGLVPPLTGPGLTAPGAGTSGLTPPGAALSGLRGVPGVSLGGGGGAGGLGGVTAVSPNSAVPPVATPVQAATTATPSGAAPVAPQLASSASGTPAAAGAGGMPPMMPPMGMGGAGAGGVPGAGTGTRAGSNGRNRRKDGTTPGLPVALSGKAGRPDVLAFAGRGRNQQSESDVPTTVQLIDEDLWQVEQKAVAPVAPKEIRRAH